MDAVLDDPEVELPLDLSAFLAALRERVVDLYCLFALADTQKGA